MKYTKEQLKKMAEVVLQDNAVGGFRSFYLFITMSNITGLHPNVVRDRIRMLAEG